MKKHNHVRAYCYLCYIYVSVQHFLQQKMQFWLKQFLSDDLRWTGIGSQSKSRCTCSAIKSLTGTVLLLMKGQIRLLLKRPASVVHFFLVIVNLIFSDTGIHNRFLFPVWCTPVSDESDDSAGEGSRGRFRPPWLPLLDDLPTFVKHIYFTMCMNPIMYSRFRFY